MDVVFAHFLLFVYGVNVLLLGLCKKTALKGQGAKLHIISTLTCTPIFCNYSKYTTALLPGVQPANCQLYIYQFTNDLVLLIYINVYIYIYMRTHPLFCRGIF